MPHPSSLSIAEVEGLGHTEIWTNLDHFLSIFGQLCKDTPPGVWVASMDMLLTVSGTCGESAQWTYVRTYVCMCVHLVMMVM